MIPDKKISMVFFLWPLLLFLSGCSPVSYKYLPTPKQFATYSKGMIAEIELPEMLKIHDGENKESIYAGVLRGEMISLSGDTLWLLPLYFEKEKRTTSGLISILRDSIESMEVLIATTTENPRSSDPLLFANVFLPFSHGWFGIITFPVNLSVNLAMANAARFKPYKMELGRDLQWENLSKFCRFPQGIPEGVSWADLQ